MTRVDARGLRCPWPALRLAKILRESGDDVEIIADDPAAARELAAVADAVGAALIARGAGMFRVTR